MPRVRIQATRPASEEIVKFLLQQDDVQVSVNSNGRKLSGAIDILVIVANLSTIALNAFLVWRAANPAVDKDSEIEEQSDNQPYDDGAEN